MRRRKPPGAAGLTTRTRSRVRSTRSSSWPSSASASRSGWASPASRSGPTGGGRCGRPVPGRTSRPARRRSRRSLRRSKAASTAAGSMRRPPGAAGSTTLNPWPTVPPRHSATVVHHRQRRLPVAGVGAWWADRRRRFAMTAALIPASISAPQRAGHRAVEQAVGVSQQVVHRERQHGHRPGRGPWPPGETSAPMRPMRSSASTASPATAAAHAGPVAGADGEVSPPPGRYTGPIARTDSEATAADALQQLHQVRGLLVRHVLPHQAGHGHDEHPPGR